MSSSIEYIQCQQIAELKERWSLLSDKLSRLNREKILETRVEEQFRLENKIVEMTAEQQKVEEQLKVLEAQLAPDGRHKENSLGENEQQAEAPEPDDRAPDIDPGTAATLRYLTAFNNRGL